MIVIDLVGGLFDTLQGILGYLEDTGRTMHLVEREQNHNVSDTVNLCMQAWVNYADIAFLPRVSYAKRGICRRRVSVCVCVCVCLSVTLRYCIKTAKRRITQTTPHDSPMTLVF